MGLTLNMHAANVPNSEALSSREREVMAMAAKGFSNKEIARHMNVVEGTIKLHLHRIYQKLGIRGRMALALLAQRASFDPPEAI